MLFRSYVTHDQAEALTLADRIVVMKGGVVQQIGTPDEIYERPCNMFVASFLGNPPMNFVDGELIARDGAMCFVREGLCVEIPSDLVNRLPSQETRRIVLGLRAEDVLSEGSGQALNHLRAQVVSVLPVGSDHFLEVDAGGAKIFLRQGKENQSRVGDRIEVALHRHRLHLFHPETQQSLLWH